MRMSAFFAESCAMSRRDLDNIVEQYLTTVKPMHYLYVDPTRAKADIVINSGMNDVAFDVVQSKIMLLLQKRGV